MARKPLRVVVDTNVLVSAIGFGGKPRQIWQGVVEGEVEAVTSASLLAELGGVLRKKMRYSPARVNQVMGQLAEVVEIVHPVQVVDVCRDPEDNRVLEAAVEADCDYVVTGDKDLLTLRRYKSVQILTPAEFIDRLQGLAL